MSHGTCACTEGNVMRRQPEHRIYIVTIEHLKLATNHKFAHTDYAFSDFFASIVFSSW